MKIRLLQEQDFTNGFIECLETLGHCQTKLTDMMHVYKQRKKHKIKTFVVVVGSRVIGTASLILEPKFRYKEQCGHIEDVCVIPDQQGIGVGKKIINHIIQYAKDKKCYKLILSSNPKNIVFYEKLGFKNHESQLRMDLI